jgi:alpha-galactosidase
MRRPVLMIAALFAVLGARSIAVVAEERVVHVEDLDVSKISQTIERPRDTGPHSAVSIGGVKFERSLPTRAKSRLYIELDGQAEHISAMGGISDKARTSLEVFRGIVGEVEFLIYGDGKLLARSGRLTQGHAAARLEANLAGVHELLLAVDGPDGAFANWVDTTIAYKGATPRTVFSPEQRATVRIASQPDEPLIHGAAVTGIRPGTPFLYVIAATGRRPMSFAASGLPEGLKLDPETGFITGAVSKPGEFPVTVTARNALGDAAKTLWIVAGDKLALTPPMGWNSWNVTEGLISETVLEEMADAMVSYGFRDAGYQYIDLDDEWVASRDQQGRPVVDAVRFPHGFKAVADYLHARGFKVGVYSSPGPETCGGYPGTLGHEEIDAKTWASWGVDLLKYDFCSATPERAHELYMQMGEILSKADRSMVYSLSGPPANWGADAKAQMWRTAGDIRDDWHLKGGGGMIDCFDRQTLVAGYQHPGAWNDPDLLVIGIYGKGASSSDLAAKGLNDVEYRTQMSLWSMLSAPLLATADLRVISPASLAILTNPEVIDVDQDPAGREPVLVSWQGQPLAWPDEADKAHAIPAAPSHFAGEVWSKQMADGSMVLALLNRSSQPMTITAEWADVGLHGKLRVRDLWLRKDAGIFTDRYPALVPGHGTELIRVWATP